MSDDPKVTSAWLKNLLLGKIDPEEAQSLSAELGDDFELSQLAAEVGKDDTLIKALASVETDISPLADPVADRLIEKLRPNLTQMTTTISALKSGADDTQDSHPTQLEYFRIEQLLGQGGMGMVYLAHDTRLNRKVAIKTLRPSLARQAESRERFLRESRLAAGLQHENVIPIYYVGEADGVPFLAMPVLNGKPLDRYLKEADGKLEVRRIVEIARQIAEGLSAAHEQGMIHRDVKPNNIWIEPRLDGSIRAKLLDFGLARGVDGDANLTESGMILGTPAYMAPEQVRGKGVDHRADLFSLGCVLYQMLTGHKPFPGADPLAVLSSLANDTPDPPRRWNPECSAELSQLTLQLLEKEPSRRPANAHEVIDRLAKEGQRLAAPPAPLALPGAQHDDSVAVKLAPNDTSSRKASSWSRRLAAAMGAVVLLLGVVYSIATNNGTIEIQTDDKDVKIVLEENGGKVTILDPISKQEWVVNTGSYKVRLASDSADFEVTPPDPFLLKRGTRQIVTLRKRSAPMATADSAKPQVIAFDGKGARVSLPNLRFDSAKPVTIEFLGSANGANTNALIAGVPGQFALRVRGNRWLVRLRDEAGALREVAGQSDIQIGRRYHVAGVWDGAALRLFVDGVMQGQPLPCANMVSAPYTAELGANPNGTDPFHGQMEAVAFTQAAVYSANFTPAASLGSAKDVLALFDFQKGATPELMAVAGKGQIGQNHGAVWKPADYAQPTDPPTPPAIAEPATPFHLVRNGKSVRRFQSLTGAYADLKAGDIIEIEGAIVHEVTGLNRMDKPLRIRATSAGRPRLVFSETIRVENTLIDIQGCDLDCRRNSFAQGNGPMWTFSQCRYWGNGMGCYGAGARFLDCLIVGNGPIVVDSTQPGGVIEFDNCLTFVQNGLVDVNKQKAKIRFKDNSIALVGFGYPSAVTLRNDSNDAVEVEAEGNLFVLRNSQYGAPVRFQVGAPLNATTLANRLQWRGKHNLYAGRWLLDTVKLSGDPRDSFAHWNKFWATPEEGSVAIPDMWMEWQRINEFDLDEARRHFEPRIQAARKKHNLPELGPNWDLIGPGAAYVRAREIAEAKPIAKSRIREEVTDGKPYLVLRDEKKVNAFRELRAAVEAAQDGDTIEMRTDELAQGLPCEGKNRRLTFRAGLGYTPGIDHLTNPGENRLRFEGIAFSSIVELSPWTVAQSYQGAGALLGMTNCSVSNVRGWFHDPTSKEVAITNCFIRDNLHPGLKDSPILVTNSFARRIVGDPRQKEHAVVRVARSAVACHEAGWDWLAPMVQAQQAGSKTVYYQVEHSFLQSSMYLLLWNHRSQFQGRQNVYTAPLGYMSGAFSPTLQSLQTGAHTDEGSVEELSEIFQPTQWRLRPETPGYVKRPDGKDFGADLSRLPK